VLSRNTFVTFQTHLHGGLMGRAGQTFLAVMFNVMCFLRGTAELANDSSPHQGIVWKSRWFIVWKWQPGSVAM